MYYSVRDVSVLDGYRLALTFEDGRRGVFDMSGRLDRKLFAPLRTKAVFDRARAMDGTVVWPGDIDIAPECLWDECVPLAEAGA